MSYSISTLLTRNLQDVFGENDPARRRAAINEIFTDDQCRRNRTHAGQYPEPQTLDHMGYILRNRGAMQRAAAPEGQRYRQSADGAACARRKRWHPARHRAISCSARTAAPLLSPLPAA